jgi:hypothetical protein
MLYLSDRHLPVSADPATDAQLASGIRRILDRLPAERAEGVWRTHPADREEPSDPEGGMTSLYYGAGGVVWLLACFAEAEERVAFVADLHRFAAAYPAPGDPDAPGWFLGHAGMTAMALSHRWDDALADQLAAHITANRDNPCWEPLWGSPGTMLAARMVGDRAPDPARWQRLWNDSAEALLAARDDDGVWTQDLYGRIAQLIGAGHGYVGNLQALFAGGDWLDPTVAQDLVAGAVRNLSAWGVWDDGAVNWRPVTVLPEGRPDRLLMQWCHGAPGVITSFRRAPADPALDALLVAAGNAVWRAGPLTKGPGLCHGTAGNGYAFLVLHERTGDPVWWERARVFASHALEQVEAGWSEHGMARASLFTGDAGVVAFLDAVRRGTGAWPLLDVTERPGAGVSEERSPA